MADKYQGRIGRRLDGNRFGYLVVLSYVYNRRSLAYWLCQCDCGGKIEVRSTHLTSSQVTSCGCRNPRNLRAASSPRWCGFGEISGSIWAEIKRSARQRGIGVEISIQDAWGLFLQQDRKCALSGLELTFNQQRYRDRTASLDRIDANLDYSLGNVQWVHRDINKMKMELPEGRFLELCEVITCHQIARLSGQRRRGTRFAAARV